MSRRRILHNLHNTRSAVYMDGTERIYASVGAIAAGPLTIGTWFYPGSITGFQSIVALGINVATHRRILGLQGAAFRFQSRAAAGASQADTTNTVTINSWNAGVCIERSNTDRQAILNGNLAGAATDTTSNTINAPTETVFGDRVSGSSQNPFTGVIAFSVIWNVALTRGEAVAFCRGVPYWWIRPGHLAAAPDFARRRDIILRTSLTAVGTPDLRSSPLTRLRMMRRNIPFIDAAPAGTTDMNLDRHYTRGVNRGRRRGAA
jgi:hypothetical protein